MDELRTPCKYNDCFRYATFKGYCEIHQRASWQSQRRERLPEDWNYRRTHVLRRDNFICYMCGEPGADSVDHVEPGDDHSYENLKACHLNVKPFCHRKKTSREANARQGHKESRERTARSEPEHIEWEF